INPNTLPAGGGAPATPGSARVVVTQNTISGNTAFTDTNVYGGGVWAGTYYDGDWTDELTDNTNSLNKAPSNGGGISTHFEDVRGDNTILIEGNTVTDNDSATSGGGLDLFAVLSLINGNSFSLVTRNNTVSGNTCSFLGGGIFTEYESAGSIS